MLNFLKHYFLIIRREPSSNKHETSSNKRTYNTVSDNDHGLEDIDEPRSSKSVRISKSYGSDILIYLLENESQT